jgi:very-short-patch-repair endonuclease
MDETLDRAIAELASHQHGIFTAVQAEEIGFDRDQRAYRVRIGRWALLYSRVYRVAGSPASWRGALLASTMATGSVAVASHQSAAELWELPGRSTDVVEITCHRWHRARPPGLIVHETKLLLPGDTTERDGIPVTSVEQTLLGLAAVSRPAVVDMALDRALRLRLTTRARLEAFVQRKARKGRNGVAVLRGLVDGHDPLAGLPESAMETKLKRLLRRHGLPTPVFQYVIRDQGRFVARVDAAYPDLRIAIEFDSYEHHTGRLALVRDTDRRNRLLQLSWQTVAFTAVDLDRDGGHAIEAVRAARRRPRPEVSGVVSV